MLKIMPTYLTLPNQLKRFQNEVQQVYLTAPINYVVIEKDNAYLAILIND